MIGSGGIENRSNKRHRKMDRRSEDFLHGKKKNSEKRRFSY